MYGILVILSWKLSTSDASKTHEDPAMSTTGTSPSAPVNPTLGLAVIAIAATVVSATGVPAAKMVTRLVRLGVPEAMVGPVLYVAPVGVAVLGLLVMRMLAKGRGPMTRLAIYTLSGGVIGFITGLCLDLFVGFFPALERLTGPLSELSNLDIAAWATAAVSLYMAAITALVALFGTPAARAMALDLEAEPEWMEVRARDRAKYAVSTVGLLGQGVFVGALAVANQVDARASMTQIAAVITVALAAGASMWSSWALWRSFDEMLRRTVIEAYAWSGVIATVVCSIWAVLESLNLAPVLSAYGAIVTLVCLQTMASLVISSNMAMASTSPKARAT
jgi:predicted secreted protein